MQASRQMHAAVLLGPRRARLEKIPLPDPAENGVRIRLEGCGVCGSNLPPWEGRPWFTYPFAPGAPGHEGWGVVEAVGAQVTRVRPGDRVAALSYHSFAEFDLAAEGDVVLLPASLGNQPFPGEALGCAWNVFQRSLIASGQKVAVVGVGFLGALLVQMAAAAGATVIAISRRAMALELAREFGASETIELGDRSQIVGRVKELTGGTGCDCVLEAAGQQTTLDIASELTRERGRLVIAGYHQDGLRQVNMQLWNWLGIDVINAHERDSKVYVEGMRSAATAVAEGKLDPAPLYTHLFPLTSVMEAFECMRTRPTNFMKALVKL